MLASVLISALAGGLGGLIGYQVAKMFFPLEDGSGVPRWPSAVGVVVALAAARPLIDWAQAPTPENLMAQVEAQYPVYAAIRQHEPAAYERMKAIMMEAVERQETPAEVAPRLRQVAADLYAKKLPSAPDDQIIQPQTLCPTN